MGVCESETSRFTYGLLICSLVGVRDSLVLTDTKSSVKVADFNDPSMCVYAAILNVWVMDYTEVFTCDLSKYWN